MKNKIKKITMSLFSALMLFSLNNAQADINHVSTILSQKYPKIKPQISYNDDAKLYKLDFNGKIAYTNEDVDYILVGGQVLVNLNGNVENISKNDDKKINQSNQDNSNSLNNVKINNNTKINGSDNYLSNLQNSTNNTERLYYMNSQYINLNSTGVDLPKNTPNYINKGFPLSDAVKIVYGNGERKVVVLADPDCPYCQQFQRDIDTANPKTLNLTLYIVPDPLSIHPNAKNKVNFIWCQKDKSAAWKSWMDYTSVGQDDSETSWDKWLALSGRTANNSCQENVSDKVISTAKSLGMRETPTILFTNGSVNMGTISLDNFIALLDYGQNHPDEIFNPKNLPKNLQ